MKRRIFTLALALVMLLGMLPMTAFAGGHNQAAPSGDADSITNGAYDEYGVWAPGGTGAIVHTVDGNQVEVSKTAAPVAGEDNTYDITLQVKTSTSVSTQTSSGAVVLVIDVSNSMDWCAECGGEYLHEIWCDHFRPLDDRVKTSQNRLTAAKKAAKEFLRTYAGDDDTANRQLAIVTFSTGYQTVLEWSNVAGGTGKNGYDSAVTTIDGLKTGGGTNLEGGLFRALENLNKSAVGSISSKNVILLTDGVPTYYMAGNGGHAGDGDEGSKTCNDKAAAQGAKIKETGATLYTVCFGAANDKTYRGGPTVGEFLKNSIATSQSTAYNADNTAELMNAFKAITENITSGLDGDGWTVTDPMADKITVTGKPSEGFTTEDGKTYTWALSKPETKTEGNVTTYVYTCTYRVTLDVQAEGFEEGKYYPTNEETFLHIGDATYAFPVPGVKGVLPRTSVTVTKEWKDNGNQDGIRPASVTIQLKKDGASEGKPVTLDASNNWSYTWDNLIEQSGGQYHVYTVEETNVKEGYTPSYTGENNELVVTNTHDVEKIDITVEKKWEDKDNQDNIRPDSVTVKLFANGADTEKTVTLNANNNWAASFEDLDKYAGGKEIKYTVEEAKVNDYTSVVTGNVTDGFTVTNTHVTKKVDVTVTKKWVDDDNRDGLRPNSITVQLYADGTATDTTAVITPDANGAWTHTFEGLEKNANGVAIKYTVKEVNVDENYTDSYDKDGIVITNTHEAAKYDNGIAVKKVWDDADDQDGIRPEKITLYLMNGEKVAATVELSDDNEWKAVFTGDNLYVNENGEKIEYTIKEVEVEGYESEVSGDVTEGFVVTNTHEPEVIESIRVTKEWKDNDDQDGIRPDEIIVNLLANGQLEGRASLNANNEWTASFENLPKYADGEEIVYTVEEVEVKGYESEVNGDVTEGFVVTNTHEPETVEKTVTKVWDDDNNKDGVRPESIEAIVYDADGKEVAKLTLTAANEWKASVELPKYKDGKEIVYTVKEATTLKDYKATYNQDTLTITNTIVRQMGTGDNFQLGLFIGLAVVSLCGIVTLVFLKKKKAKE